MIQRLRRRVTGTTVAMWIIGFVILAGVIYGAVTSLASAQYPPKVWVDLIVFGIAQGSVYALVALGLSLIHI